VFSKGELNWELQRESTGAPNGQENWKNRNGRSRKAEGKRTTEKQTVGIMQRKDWALQLSGNNLSEEQLHPQQFTSARPAERWWQSPALGRGRHSRHRSPPSNPGKGFSKSHPSFCYGWSSPIALWIIRPWAGHCMHCYEVSSLLTPSRKASKATGGKRLLLKSYEESEEWWNTMPHIPAWIARAATATAKCPKHCVAGMAKSGQSERRLWSTWLLLKNRREP